jgi:hypothetical protein
MKSKKFEDLRGTKTAVHCPTQADWDKVSEIAGYKWESNAKWSDCGPDTVISLLSIAHGVYDGFFSRNNFTIIRAADFIAANTEQAPDLTGTRPAIEWLQLLPEPYRGKALEAVKVAPNWPNEICEYNNCVQCAFDWELSSEGYKFWDSVDNYLQDPSNPLPPLPSEGVEAEKVEAETDIQKLTKATMIKFAEQEKRLQLMTDLCYKLQGKVNILESKLSEKPDTTQPAISQTPAEPVKLPVTIEEVWEEEKSIRGQDAFLVDTQGNSSIYHGKFENSELINEYRKKSTAKKDRAFSMLLKISEAQNEIAPRGEFVWYAEYEIAKDEIKPRKRVMYTTAYGYGLITFHSEQGLKDCIEANKELWMDLLKSE